MGYKLDRGVWLLGGVGIGLGLMYMLDPDRGRTRRALLKDKAGSLVLHSSTSVGKESRNARNHLRGLLAETRSRLRRSGITDDGLAERLRAEIDRLAPTPGPLHATVRSGRVSLSGPVLASQVQAIVEQVAMIPGVMGVDNRLTVYQDSEDMPHIHGATGPGAV